jgi:hypothetical protein
MHFSKTFFLASSIIAMLFLSGCSNNKQSKEVALAKVFDKALYPTDVEGIFPENISADDSLQLLKAHVDRWIRRQLMLNRAEKNLNNEQKDVSKQIDDYRSFLLIFKYEQEYIRQKLDTNISYSEVEAFYRQNTDNFILNESLIKALYIKLRKDNTYIDRFKNLYRSQKEDDIKALDNLAYQVAIKYDYFNDSWVPFSKISKELPSPIDNIEDLLRRSRYIEMEDDNFVYLVSIRESILKGQVAPLIHEKENIRSIILNKRKQKLISDLEIKIYNDARNHQHFTINIE